MNEGANNQIFFQELILFFYMVDVNTRPQTSMYFIYVEGSNWQSSANGAHKHPYGPARDLSIWNNPSSQDKHSVTCMTSQPWHREATGWAYMILKCCHSVNHERNSLVVPYEQTVPGNPHPQSHPCEVQSKTKEGTHKTDHSSIRNKEIILMVKKLMDHDYDAVVEYLTAKIFYLSIADSLSELMQSLRSGANFIQASVISLHTYQQGRDIHITDRSHLSCSTPQRELHTPDQVIRSTANRWTSAQHLAVSHHSSFLLPALLQHLLYLFAATWFQTKTNHSFCPPQTQCTDQTPAIFIMAAGDFSWFPSLCVNLRLESTIQNHHQPPSGKDLTYFQGGGGGMGVVGTSMQILVQKKGQLQNISYCTL